MKDIEKDDQALRIEEAGKLAQKAREWANSADGQRDMREAAAEADAILKQLDQARRISPERLYQPFTI